MTRSVAQLDFKHIGNWYNLFVAVETTILYISAPIRQKGTGDGPRRVSDPGNGTFGQRNR